uniref:NXPE family member 3-like isoform X1 n=1 Tax=Ciona intestinalis TaxID=7719 RepID=UPI000EF4F138|nr:NXPE family member 3-like isoform X1 [Ciona intestinalis]|eukprot:XP_026695135.1 NXPE family member 3-like isoform X1 [Ciona intestinalis]
MKVAMEMMSSRKYAIFICLTILGLFATYLISEKTNISTNFEPNKRVGEVKHSESVIVNFQNLLQQYLKIPFGSKIWRTFYPEVDALLRLIEDNKLKWPAPITKTTSANLTKLSVKNRAEGYIVGDTVVATIEAKNGLGERKQHGGDYFYCRLMSTSEEGDILNTGLACDIIDHGNGFYTASAPLLWPGNSTLFVDLVHSSEAVVALALESAASSAKDIHFVSTYPSGEEVDCNVGLKPNPSRPLCNLSHPEKGSSWFCYSDSAGNCPDVTYTETRYDNRVSFVGTTPLFDPATNFKVPIQMQGNVFQVKDSTYTSDILKNLPRCETESGVSERSFENKAGFQSGFYLNGQWQSLQCEPRVATLPPEQCLQNKVIYCLGDSTMRQWYFALKKHLQLNDNPTKMQGRPNQDVWQVPRVGYRPSHNITVYYRAHGLPLHNPGPPESHTFIVDTLKEIDTANGENTLVVINLALHFQLVDPLFYIQRLQAVRSAILELQRRTPGVKVFIRGCIRHRNTMKVVPTEWYSYRLNKILRKTFASLPGVGFIDVWSMTTVLPNLENIHPTDERVWDHIRLFMSYFC